METILEQKSTNGIGTRYDREREFFNRIASRASEIYQKRGELDYLSHPCVPENRHLLNLFSQGFKNLRVLDLGCGLGEATLSFAKRGANVVGVDISSVSLEHAKSFADKGGRFIEYVLVSNGELPFSSSSFDLVYGNGVLHHLDLACSLPEIKRVLKTNGVGFFIEPTTGNPLISVYRWLAKNQRSPDEKPMGRADYQLIDSIFPKSTVTPYQVATLLVFLKMFFVEKLHPSRHSYWRIPVLEREKYEGLYLWGSRVDERLRQFSPRFFKRFSWNDVVVVRKNTEANL